MKRIKRPRPRLFCAHCGRQVAQGNALLGTVQPHNEPLDVGEKGPARRCPGSHTKGLAEHPAQPGGRRA
jgi:hypothetical protein